MVVGTYIQVASKLLGRRYTKDFGPVVDINEACKPSQHWILLKGFES